MENIAQNNKKEPYGPNLLSGGVEETRTPHLSNANAALYQMSYYPNKYIIAHSRKLREHFL